MNRLKYFLLIFSSFVLVLWLFIDGSDEECSDESIRSNKEIESDGLGERTTSLAGFENNSSSSMVKNRTNTEKTKDVSSFNEDSRVQIVENVDGFNIWDDIDNLPAGFKKEVIGKISSLNSVDFDSLSTTQIDQVLANYSLGEGRQFLENIDKYTTNFDPEEFRNFLSGMRQEYDSVFTSGVTNSEGPDYFFRMSKVDGDSLLVEIVSNGSVYYSVRYDFPYSTVKYGHNVKFPNFVLELPPNEAVGYAHSMYLVILVSETREQMITNLYNTNQNIDETNYVLAEKMIFTARR